MSLFDQYDEELHDITQEASALLDKPNLDEKKLKECIEDAHQLVCIMYVYTAR